MPTTLRPAFEVLENEDGYHGGPDLPHNRVLVEPHEGFDAQVLLDELEKALYLPARLVERTDGFGIPRAVVGHQLDGVLGRRPVFASSLARLAARGVVRAVDDHAAQGMRVLALRVPPPSGG